MSGIEEYRPGSAFPGRDRPDGRGVESSMAGAAARPRGRAERAVLRPRRRRLRAAVVLRRAGRDAEHRPGRRAGPALHQHAHDGALLADARLHPDRPQPPLQRRGVHHGARDRLSRLRRPHAVRERHAAGDAARARLQHVLPRQVALSPVRGEHAGRPVPSLAAGPWLRALLRLPRRRDQSVVSRPDPGQRFGAAAQVARGGLPPHRGSRRQGDQVRSWTRTSTRRRSPSSCTTPPAPRTLRTMSRRSGPTGTRARSTRAGTPTARRSSRTRRRSASRRPTPSSRRATPTCRSGTPCPTTSGGCTPA